MRPKLYLYSLNILLNLFNLLVCKRFFGFSKTIRYNFMLKNREVAEWSKALAWNASIVHAIEGSNPFLSTSKLKRFRRLLLFLLTLLIFPVLFLLYQKRVPRPIVCLYVLQAYQILLHMNCY